MRYFTDGRAMWRWDGLEMFVSYKGNAWEISTFTSPEELLAERDVVETDEHGDPIKPAAEDVAAHKGDEQQQIEKDMS